jgi:hypothetical protein
VSGGYLTGACWWCSHLDLREAKADSPVRHRNLVLRVVDGGAARTAISAGNCVHWSYEEKVVLLQATVYPAAVAAKGANWSFNSPPAVLQMLAAQAASPHRPSCPPLKLQRAQAGASIPYRVCCKCLSAELQVPSPEVQCSTAGAANPFRWSCHRQAPVLQLPSTRAAIDGRRSCNPPPPLLQAPSAGAAIGGRRSSEAPAAVLQALLLDTGVAPATTSGATTIAGGGHWCCDRRRRGSRCCKSEAGMLQGNPAT